MISKEKLYIVTTHSNIEVCFMKETLYYRQKVIPLEVLLEWVVRRMECL